jgi:predicted alpha/beta-fold hydrolase
MHKFKPAFGLQNRHLQTIYSSFFRKNKNLDIEIETFTLSDGDFVEAYWLDKPLPNTTTPIVVIFHGLEGSYTSPYINGIMHTLQKAGMACVLMHFRSCSGKLNRKAKVYHSGQTEDAKEFIESLAQRFSSNGLFAIGYSLGGNMLLKLLGECGDNTPLKAAISVCAPLDLAICSDVISQGFSSFYEQKMLNNLKNTLLLKYEQHDMEKLLSLKKDDVKNIKTIREFDEVYTAKINGFGNASNYYKICSSKQFLKDIKIKTLLIHSKDDPFMTHEVLPTKEELSSSVTLEVHKNGGHLGFISGSIFKPIYWLDKRIISYFHNDNI